MVKSISKLKKELDKWFSLFIRLRNADDLGFVECITSGRFYHYKNIHAGHFMSRKSHSTRWDEVNVQPQSAADNLFGQGEQYKFGKSREIQKFSRVDYEEKISYYKNLVNKLKKEKGIE